MDNLIVSATQHYAYGWLDSRAVWGGPRREPGPFERFPLGDRIWPFDAEMRGWDMALYKERAGGLHPVQLLGILR